MVEIYIQTTNQKAVCTYLFRKILTQAGYPTFHCGQKLKCHHQWTGDIKTWQPANQATKSFIQLLPKSHSQIPQSHSQTSFQVSPTQVSKSHSEVYSSLIFKLSKVSFPTDVTCWSRHTEVAGEKGGCSHLLCSAASQIASTSSLLAHCFNSCSQESSRPSNNTAVLRRRSSGRKVSVSEWSIINHAENFSCGWSVTCKLHSVTKSVCGWVDWSGGQ